MENAQWNQILKRGYDLPDVNLFKPTIYFGLDYQLPFPKKGVRIIPELSFSQYQFSIEYDRIFDPIDLLTIPEEDFYKSSFYGLSLNFDFYLFNFSTPTTTPSFSKDKHWFKNGFFFRVAPTYYHIRYKNHSDFIDLLSSVVVPAFNYTWHNFSVRVASGIDFGVNQSLTISPIISYTFLNELNWYNLGIQRQERRFDTVYEKDRFLGDAHHLQFGIRLSFLLKKKNIFTGRAI